VGVTSTSKRPGTLPRWSKEQYQHGIELVASGKESVKVLLRPDV